jgi:hypothetical protein
MKQSLKTSSWLALAAILILSCDSVFISSKMAHYHNIPFFCEQNGNIETGMSACVDKKIKIYNPNKNSTLYINQLTEILESDKLVPISVDSDGITVLGILDGKSYYTGVINSFKGTLKYRIDSISKTNCDKEYSGAGVCQVPMNTPITFYFEEEATIYSKLCDIDETGTVINFVSNTSQYCPLLIKAKHSEDYALHYISYYDPKYIPVLIYRNKDQICPGPSVSRIDFFKGREFIKSKKRCSDFDDANNFFVLDDKNGRVAHYELSELN